MSLLPKPRQACICNVVNSVILIDSSETSDSQQKSDAVAAQEKTMCFLISVVGIQECEDFRRAVGILRYQHHRLVLHL